MSPLQKQLEQLLSKPPAPLVSMNAWGQRDPEFTRANAMPNALVKAGPARCCARFRHVEAVTELLAHQRSEGAVLAGLWKQEAAREQLSSGLRSLMPSPELRQRDQRAHLPWRREDA